MSKKEKLANQYIELKKEFDGEEFNESLAENQIWYLTKNFKVVDIENKIISNLSVSEGGTCLCLAREVEG